jgi:Mg2+ and Co2+ transporter CorA
LVMTPSVFAPLLAQTTVKDENRINQLQREVWWSEWDGHTPGWFYWLIELFQSDEYRDEDRRNFLQLFVTVVMTKINKEQTEKEKEYVDAVAQDKLFILADITVDYAYELAKSELNELRNRVSNNLSKAQQIGVYAPMIREISNENQRIEGRIYALRKSDLTNADRQLGYQSEAEAFRKLIVMSSRIIIAVGSIKR